MVLVQSGIKIKKAQTEAAEAGGQMCVREELLRYGQMLAATESALSEPHSSFSCLVLFQTLNGAWEPQ